MIISGASPRPAGADELLDARTAARISRLDLHSRRTFAGKLQGERRSKKRGRSVEFADHRQYAPGDDLRFIDWNIYARFDRLFIKLFMEEQDLSLHVLVDASASMDTPSEPFGRAANENTAASRLGVNKKLFACRVAAGLAHLALGKQNRVGMSVFGAPGASRPAVLGECRGRQNIPRVMKFLLDSAWVGSTWIENDGTAISGAAGTMESNSLASAVRLLASPKVGKGVVVVLSDFFTDQPSGYADALRTLGTLAGAPGGGMDACCIQVVAPAERNPELLGRAGIEALTGDLMLSDAESGRTSEVTISPALIKRYKQRFAEFSRELEATCASRGVACLSVDTDADVAELLTGPLRMRGVLG